MPHTSTAAKLIQIGIALSSETNLNSLLELIVTEARHFTNADAGSLYLKEEQNLRYVVSQTKSLTSKNEYIGMVIPITNKRIVGYVANTGKILNIPDAYKIPSDKEYSFTSDIDKKVGYRTTSVLTVPIKDKEGEIIGVLQLINALDENGSPVPFDSEYEDLTLSLASQAGVAIKNAKLTEGIRQAHLETIIRLSIAAEYKDKETGNHIKRIIAYSGIIAKGLNMAKKEIELIEYASPMHDVGKIGIPDAVLLKPGKHDPEERKIMESHTIIGGEILKNPDSEIIKVAREIALTHHEKWDGSGYPNQLKGGTINLYGRIVALADVFDALSSKRCYKPAFPMDKVLSIIKEGSNSHFDPACSDAFFNNIDEILKVHAEQQDKEQEP